MFLSIASATISGHFEIFSISFFNMQILVLYNMLMLINLMLINLLNF